MDAPLRLRALAAGLLALLLVLAGTAAAWARREAGWQARWLAGEQQRLQLAWDAQRQRSRHLLQARLDAVVAGAAAHRAAGSDEQALARALSALAVPGEQIDLYDTRRTLRATSSGALTAAPLLDAAGLLGLAGAGTPRDGLQVPERGRAWHVLAQRLQDGSVLAVGQDAAPLLVAAAALLQQPLVLRTPRGQWLAGSAGSEPAAAPVAPVTVPLAGLHGHDSAWLQAPAPTAAPPWRAAAWMPLAAGTLAAALLLLLALQRLLAPLQRGVALAEALAGGGLQAAADDADLSAPGEAGRLARAAERLRTALRAGDALREERTRVVAQQQRLLRDRLRELAGTLTGSARAEVMAQLAPEGLAAAGGSGDEPQLARLATLLGRLTGLVGSQHTRLLALLHEVQASVQTRERYASLQQELAIATQLQRSILPRGHPATAAVTLHAAMVPAREVGGDFYDWFLLDERRLALVVADVSGKGVPAAFFMAVARTLLRAGAASHADPAATLARLNAQLAADNEQTMFVTLFHAVLDLETGTLQAVNAGHNPPLLRRADGTLEWLARGRNPALAVIDGLAYTTDTVQLARGDGLLLYTDGITEAADPRGALFGEDALAAAAARAAREGDAVVDAVVDAVRRFEDGAPQADDITAVWLRYEGPPCGA